MSLRRRLRADARTSPSRSASCSGAMVGAVDAASAAAETDDCSWQTHVLRASDGSHYVAFSITAAAVAPLPSGPAGALRAARHATRDRVRSARALADSRVAGRQSNRRRRRSRRNAASPSARCRSWARPAPGQPDAAQPNAQTADLAAMDLERRREPGERQEERERQRRAELEGRRPQHVATCCRSKISISHRALARRRTRHLSAR